MDIANQTWGMVIGTGDLSELALGWATYNGDHMSMYGVNAGIPKTLVKHLVQWVAENGMDWMYANCSTTAQRGALDWWKKFRDATKPVFEELYEEVAKGNEAQRSIDTNSKEGYRDGLNKELKELRESEMWQAGVTVRKLRPENN